MYIRGWDDIADQELQKFRRFLNIKNAAELSRVQPEEIIANCLYRGGKLLLTGASKTFKSFALLHLAYCVANGTRWLNWDVSKGRVLFINFELFEAEAGVRIDSIEHSIGNPKADQKLLDIANLRGKLRSVEEIAKCAKHIKYCGYKLIIIDPAYKLLAGRKENVAEEIASLMMIVEAIAAKANVAVAIAHHFSKGNQALKAAIDRMSGSGVWGRDPDAILAITAHKESFCYTVESEIRSFPPTNPFVVRFNYPLFELQKDLDPTDLKLLESKKKIGRPEKWPDAVLAIPFRENGKNALTMKEWVEGLHNRGIDIGRTALMKRASKQGLDGVAFTKLPDGRYQCRL